VEVIVWQNKGKTQLLNINFSKPKHFYVFTTIAHRLEFTTTCRPMMSM